MAEKNTQVGLIDAIKILFGKDQDVDGMVYKEGRLLMAKSNSHTNYAVKEGTEVICDEAFLGKNRLNSVSLPDSLTTIGYRAFAGCKNLNELHLPKNLNHLGMNSIPTSLSQLVIWNDKFTDLEPNSFEGYSNPNLTVKVPFRNVEKIKKKVGEKAQVTNINGRRPVKIGLNSSGEPLTFAKIQLSVSGNIKVVRIDKKDVYIISDSFSKVGLSIFDSSNKILFSDKDIVVDGFINGFEPIKDLKVKYLSDQTPVSLGELPNHPGGVIPQIIIKKILDDVKKNKDQSKEFEVEIMEAVESQPLTLEFYLRLINGIFDSSKLSFINFDNPKGDIKSRLGQLSKNQYFLNFIAYDNKIYECRLDPTKVTATNTRLIERFTLTPQINLSHGSLVATFNVKESSKENKDGKPWFDKEVMLGIITYYYERNLYPFKDLNGNGKYGYGFVPVDDYDKIRQYTSSGPAYEKDGKDYFFDLIWIIEPKFDDAREFKEGMAAVKIKDKWRFIDMKGNFINSQSYDNIEDTDYGVAFVESKEKWGLINNKGKTLIKPMFDYVWNFYYDMARVKMGDKYGFVDTRGKLVVKPQYENASDFSEGLACVKMERGYGYIDILGKIAISPQWEYARDFHNGYAAVRKTLAKDVLKSFLKKGNDDGPEKWGYIDRAGNVVIKPQFFDVSDFKDGRAVVYKTGDDYENDKGIPVEIQSGMIALESGSDPE